MSSEFVSPPISAEFTPAVIVFALPARTAEAVPEVINPESPATTADSVDEVTPEVSEAMIADCPEAEIEFVNPPMIDDPAASVMLPAQEATRTERLMSKDPNLRKGRVHISRDGGEWGRGRALQRPGPRTGAGPGSGALQRGGTYIAVAQMCGGIWVSAVACVTISALLS